MIIYIFPPLGSLLGVILEMSATKVKEYKECKKGRKFWLKKAKNHITKNLFIGSDVHLGGGRYLCVHLWRRSLSGGKINTLNEKFWFSALKDCSIIEPNKRKFNKYYKFLYSLYLLFLLLWAAIVNARTGRQNAAPSHCLLRQI